MNDDQLKITVLGGQEEIGLNSTVIETADDIVIIDLGNNFDDECFGLDYYIPNIDLLESKLDKIRGLLITHGHYDHRGALPFLIDKLGYPPIYGSPFTIQLIRQHLRRFKKEKLTRFIPLYPRQEVNLGKVNIKAIHLTHSIIGSYGYLLKTNYGNIFHTGDFKLDEAPFREKVSDYDSLRQASQENILVAMIDSTRANREGHSRSETSIAENLDKLIKKSAGRVIVSTFAQMITRINQITLIGKKYGRQSFIKGTTLEKTIRIAKEMDLLDRSLKFKDAEEMKNYPDSQILLLATGSQGEEKAALKRMLEAKTGNFKIKPTDTIILSSSSIPSNIVTIQKMVDSFADRGCRVYTDDIIDIHAGGHAHQDELKEMIQLLKPRFILPVEGYISFRHQLAHLAHSLGYQKGQLILAKNNQPVIINQRGFKKTGGKMKKPGVVISDLVVKDGSEIINQRKKAAQRGLLTVLVHPRNGEIKISSWGVPNIVLRQIKKNLLGMKIPKTELKKIRIMIKKLLLRHFEEELIPVINVDSF
ncbi:MAG TPA: ribonuclease J [Candidatus Bathyarchaeia archaeon]|nr:ribonuclease J [Candidatus Bathyarchaeia archaeon]